MLFDRDAIYVAVRAFDKEPDRIVGLLTRRDDFSPSDWVSILIDSYYDHRTAYRVRHQPGRREVRSLLVQRQQHRPQLGRGLGCGGLAHHRWLAGGVPHPVLSVALQDHEPGCHRVRRDPDGRARERNVHVAAARAKRERLRVVVRRAARPPHRGQRSPAGADAVRGRPGRHCAGGRAAIRWCSRRIPA